MLYLGAMGRPEPEALERSPLSLDTPQTPSYTFTMATSRDAPNPLRPYYIPPTIGLPPDLPQNTSSPSSHAHARPSAVTKPSFGSQARDILSDLDYDSYFPDASPGVADHAKKLLDKALWSYTSVLLAQPFEVRSPVRRPTAGY